MYITWEKQHYFYGESDEEMKLLTFQEIIQEYNGSVDDAMSEFLIREIYNTTKNDYLGWLREKQPLEKEEPIQASVLQFLCVMKSFVMYSSMDDLKELLGLDFSLK
jgi:chemotaxis protein CheY-P-specific phosphatase CheC